MNNYKRTIISCIIFLIYLNLTMAYKMENNREVHQHITNESQLVWKLIPNEIKNHLKNSIKTNINTLTARNVDFNPGEDIINGSAEEDIRSRPLQHFWNPDTPQNGRYNDGLNSPWNRQSSYRIALGYWTNNVIPAYLRGDINKSYYWLGRVAHLLEDATQPGHVLLDCHPDEPILELLCDQSQIENPDDSVLEEYTGDNFQALRTTYNWTGSNFAGQQYNYENIPNLSNFNWGEVGPTNPLDKQNIELFRLFWYTAQKTQYFASDDVDGNDIYVNLSGSTKNFSIPLWDGENLRIINRSIYLATDDLTDSGANVSAEANAMLPHSMKSVAGLYRLFWDAVHIDWPTENHDYRRTGFTLLKGDLSPQNTKNAMDFFLDAASGTTEQVVKPSIANIDGDNVLDVVILVHKTTFNQLTKMYGIEAKDPLFGEPKRKWKNPIEVLGGAAYFPPTLADLDGDGKKEIITGVRNGTLYVYNYSNGVVKERWKYNFEERASPGSATEEVSFNGGSAVADIDLNGDMEVIVADVIDTDHEWPGKVYVLDGSTGVNQTSYTFGNGGAYGSVSVENIDTDDNPEIIVPSQYGIIVLDYNKANGKLEKKCNTTEGRIWGSAVIADVDKDNDYELIYVTTSFGCDQGATCTNKLHVIDPLNNCNEYNANFPITFTDNPRATPTLANLDSDSNLEIIISLEQTIPDGLGSIKAYDGVTGAEQWTYNAEGSLHPGFVSPNVADIDNDGNYNIILGENDGSTVYILNHTGKLFFGYPVTGFMDNGLAIADLDNDGVAEIAFKRAASPETVFVSISNTNTPPEITKISNATAIAGNLINISQLISTSDAEGNNVQLLYSSPFNSSGQWQSTINDTGNYSILVEASDGNLSTTQFIDVIVFNQTTKLQNQFADGATQKLLNFTQPGNLTVNIRLPKNATVIYSKMKITGLAPL